MLSLEQIFKAQARYGVGTSSRGVDTVEYSSYLGSVRRSLTERTPADFYNWTPKLQDDFTDKCIVEHVKRHSQMVEGFVDSNDEFMIDELLAKLREDIIENGILRYALEDDTVQEIQINDCKTIFVVKGGVAVPYTDSNGNLLQFADDEELHTAFDRLIYNANGNTPRMTTTNPILNSRTAAKGYRVSAVNSSTITPDLRAGCDFPVTTVTIRKYSDIRFDFDDFVAKGSMTPKMAKLIRLCAIANLKIFFVGRTSSGKTTLMGTCVKEILVNNKRKRIIFIQNPTEAMFYNRSLENLANEYNALHWEAQEVDAKLLGDPTVPTMKNLFAVALRNSPDIIVPGEMRLAEEFAEAFKALKYDQRIISTFHASDANDALNRWASELASLGGNMMDYLYPLARSVDLVISQNLLEDGRRMVTGIEEVTGRVFEGGVVEVNKLAGFTYTGETKRNPDNSIKEICGNFECDGKISDVLRQKFYAAGITKEELAEF